MHEIIFRGDLMGHNYFVSLVRQPKIPVRSSNIFYPKCRQKQNISINIWWRAIFLVILHPVI